ncbi:MAG: hypothetical protein EPO20_14660 [Betaproteobacteria bacterium]|nr:MAG: hypothetical protein EPO20_14660 [Betaproteobacteria bacterium]
MTLKALLAEAQALAGQHPCATHGHRWGSDGGRACPLYDTDRDCGGLQTVYVCEVCDEYDYGEPGGPGAADCARPCRVFA